MLCFNVEARDLEELEGKIKYTLDKDIKRYFYELYRDGENVKEPADYFELTADVIDQDHLIHLDNDENNYRQNSRERQINKKFIEKIKSVFQSTSKEEIEKFFSKFVNAKKLFIDIEKLGMPEFYSYSNGVWISGEINNIDIGDFDVKLMAGDSKIDISHLRDLLVDSIGGRPGNLMVDCEKCYDVYNFNMESSGLFIYWRKFSK